MTISNSQNNNVERQWNTPGYMKTGCRCSVTVIHANFNNIHNYFVIHVTAKDYVLVTLQPKTPTEQHMPNQYYTVLLVLISKSLTVLFQY